MRYLWTSKNLENIIDNTKVSCYFLNQGMIVADVDEDE
jgi:hypothetical protein